MTPATLLMLGASGATPPTRSLPILSKQPAFCQKQLGTNYFWLAQADMACLGFPATGCGGANPCGWLSVNGQRLNITNANADYHDVCGTCQGCPTWFIGLDASIPNEAHAIEGQLADIAYHPPPAQAQVEDVETDALPDCPTLPSPWKTLENKQIAPACSPSESAGSLGVTETADACLAKAKASGAVNYALWRGDTDKSCQACAFRWRGPAENFQFSDLSGATSFVWFISLPPPVPSGPCPACPPNPEEPSRGKRLATLSNGRVKASFGARGLASLSSPSVDVDVSNDAFALGLDRSNCTCSSSLATPTMKHLSADAVSFTFAAPAQNLVMNVTYELRADADFVSKTISLTDTGKANLTRQVNAVSAMEGATLQSNGAASTDTRTASNVQFFRWPSTQAAASRTAGAFLTAQNQFVQSPSLAWTPDQNWTTLDTDGDAAARTLDSVIIGLYEGSTSQLEFAETAAVTSAVSRYLVAPSEDNVTVKINIAWCENDYQLDISLPEDRAAYKRIIDRAADFGITHILFAPRNSDVSSAANNTDPWGWEQILWFGYGQQLRMGEWKPGDPLAASTQEMLDYFKLKGVKPVAYVYPILAFLAGTLPGGGSPPWIVQGTYMSTYMSGESTRDASATLPTQSAAAAGVGAGMGGVLRSNLANDDFIRWLPETMVEFAEQTGAGGFSFDLTYWEEGLPVASEYAQWAGWRDILAQLHTKRGGKACGGSRCVVDNRQANHGWGAWMWALGGTYAEPLMSDEQPGSWPFYEADLHTDRLAGNKQRAIGKSYRDEYCPNEALPGFAFHQTDRDPTALQNAACGAGRCSNHSRARDFDLLGYRYSLLSSIGSGGLNNVLNMLPARDPQEFSLFPKEDLSFVHGWLAWADANVALLKLTRPVPSLSTPGLGLADGTIMLRADNTGAMFLFNPTARPINVSLPLSGDGAASLGFACGSSTPPVMVTQLSSSERTSVPYNLDLLSCTDTLDLTLAPTSARVLEFDQWMGAETLVVLGSPGSATYATGKVAVGGAQGESGTPAKLVVVLPKGLQKVSTATVNGQVCSFSSGLVQGLPALTIRGAWGGARFGRAHEILPSAASSQAWSGKFSVPQSALDQLVARNTSYPIVYNTDPQDTDDANVPWLAPGRLLLFVKYATPIDDTLNISGAVDGTPLLVRKGYNTIVRNAGRFIGHWADVTPLVKPGAQQTLTLQLPGQKPLGVFFDNVETILTDSFASTA